MGIPNNRPHNYWRKGLTSHGLFKVEWITCQVNYVISARWYLWSEKDQFDS